MTRSEAPARTRRRGLAATAIALVVALFAVVTPLSASADELPTTGTISGTVTTPAGQPVEGASVLKAFSGQSATTDVNGYFELTELELGAFEVSTYSAGYQYTPSQQGVLTVEAPSVSLSFVLTPFPVGAGIISGLVTVDGVPLAGKEVGAFEQTTGQNVSTYSDENGLFELSGLADGAWRVFSYSPEYQPVYPDTVTISSATPTATVNVPFVSWPVGTSSVIGAVTDAQTGDPILGSSVSLQGIDVAHQSSVSTDENGAFRFDSLPAGSYSVQTYVPGYLTPIVQVEVAAGQEAVANVELVAINSTISGRVTGPNGVPVAGLWVEAVGTQVGSIGSATTDANGNYVITGLGAVGYTVSVAGYGTPFVAQQKTVTAVANGDLTVNFALKKRKTGTIAGFILNADGSSHAEAVCATLYSAKTKKPVARTITAGDQFGGDGTYGFADVQPGKYTVRFKDCDGDPATKYKKQFLGGVKKFKNATFITVVAGQDSYENNYTLVPRG